MTAMPSPLPARHRALLVGYEPADPNTVLADPCVLAAIAFNTPPDVGDPRLLSVPLTVLDDSSPLEVWRVSEPVRHGRDGDLAWSCGGGYLMLALRVAEDEHGGLEGASQYAYVRLLQAMVDHGHPYLLRAWNYLADINQGEGDQERYRRFTIGRARGMASIPSQQFPAATAIGRVDGVRELLVYGLAARAFGRPIENPRQVSAYRYPRQYGPVPPSFARAMHLNTGDISSLLISGTSSVVGHASAHGQAQAQIAETLLNLDSLAQAGAIGARLPMASACLKAYLRHTDDAAAMRDYLHAAGLPAQQLLCLHGDICRTDLLVEIDGIATA